MVQESNRRSIAPATTRSPRLLRRRDARRREILRAAARSFRTRGFAETGMRDIAKAADLSPANLYHYFGGKDEILFYCQDRALDRMLEAVGAAGRSRAHPADRLRDVLAAHLRAMLDEVEGATAHLQVESLPPTLRKTIVAKRDRYERALRRLVENGVKTGDFVVVDAALVTRAMLGALNSTLTWFRPDGPQSADEVGAATAQFLVRGVVKKGRGQRAKGKGSQHDVR